MMETSQPSTSKAARINSQTSNVVDNDFEMEDWEENQDSCSLWCIEDDTMFYAQGLKHHSAGKGKSVYVTWNENYLLNFVFKTSKTGTTTLTKVRISLPVHKQQLEEIANMLILEMNTLLYMKSGRVYYFSSVKSMHKVDWLTGVRCMTACPPTLFSVIRLVYNEDQEEHDQQRILSLEVYKDLPQLGKYTSDDHVLCHSYDISFDLENLFNCDWLEETYTLTSLITEEKNIEFLKQLVAMGNIFRSQDEVIELEMNQELHIFTISGNVFMLVGASVAESDNTSTNPEVQDYNIRLLNTYACNIECIRIDCEKNLLIVLLQSGHMDIWYKSSRMFGALFHQQHQISQFLNYDYWPLENIFYFTTLDDVIQLKIITSNTTSNEQECIVKETRKSISGMIACTWVESLEQLICLSFNNIFYRINFNQPTESLELTDESETKYENLNHLYVLNLKRIKDLTAKAQIVNDLLEQPKHLHNGIEKEFQKQQILALASKSEIFKKIFQCHLEYHVNIPGIEYFDEDCVQIKTTNDNSSSIYCLIFMSLKNKHNYLSSVFTATLWYLHITTKEHSLQLHIPYELLNKQLCLIIGIPLKHYVNQCLPNYSLNLLSFLNHQSQHVCLKFKLCLATNEKTYLNIFSYNIHNLSILRNFLNDIESLLKEQDLESTSKSNAAMDCSENAFKLKHLYKISKSVLQNIMEKVKAKSWSSLSGMDFKMYYLHQYLIVLNYDDSKEILQMSSNYPVAIFYIKLLLIHADQSCNELEIIDNSSLHNMQQMIMNYQSDIEHLYGSLISLDAEEVNSNTISMHLENMSNVYLKLRNEFYDIFR
ncbi:uncharacterized protein LOC135951295 [Calliphora vicina]|uniref:uncharacterized protein LOC135951295 n=1 Tax=Calliphora vicina TaxID=7373 RepID=UPI00325B2AF7